MSDFLIWLLLVQGAGLIFAASMIVNRLDDMLDLMGDDDDDKDAPTIPIGPMFDPEIDETA